LDLSFARFDRGTTITALPTDLAVLLAAVTGRQAADGAFDGWTAALIVASTARSARPVAQGSNPETRMKTMFT
jgi:hypothetical protein